MQVRFLMHCWSISAQRSRSTKNRSLVHEEIAEKPHATDVRSTAADARVHGLPPSEADMQRYFRVSPPAVHQMILTLEARGLVERVPRTPRSVRLMLPRSDLPDLE